MQLLCWTRRGTALLTVLLLLVARPTVATARARGSLPSFCPDNNGTYSWSPNPSTGEDHWFMSPCSKAVPPGGSHTHASYVTKSSGNYVRIPFNQIAKDWHYVGENATGSSMFQANFTSSYTPGNVEITVTCDSSVALGKVESNGNVGRQGAAVYWTVPIKMGCVSTLPSTPEPTTPTTAPGSFCPDAAGTYNWTQQQVSPQGEYNETVNWWMSPCGPHYAPGYTFPPLYLAMAKVSGFNYIPFDHIISYWTPNKEGTEFVGNFTASTFGGATAIWAAVTVTCDESVAPGTVDTNGVVFETNWNQDNAQWRIPVRMACQAPSSTPTPMTTTPAPNGKENCGQYSTCDACTNSNSGTCGFCRGTKTCESGTSNGPEKGNCPAGHWRWVSSQCEN